MDKPLSPHQFAILRALVRGESLNTLNWGTYRDKYGMKVQRGPSFADQMILAELGLINENKDGWFVTDQGKAVYERESAGG